MGNQRTTTTSSIRHHKSEFFARENYNWWRPHTVPISLPYPYRSPSLAAIAVWILWPRLEVSSTCPALPEVNNFEGDGARHWHCHHSTFMAPLKMYLEIVAIAGAKMAKCEMSSKWRKWYQRWDKEFWIPLQFKRKEIWVLFCKFFIHI